MSNKILQSLSYLIVFAAVGLVILPLDPSLPGPDLDGSWSYAIAEALSQGMVFGKDLIFTFGPYGGIYTKLYHPDVYLQTLLASAYLTICYAFGLLTLAGRNLGKTLSLALVIYIVGQQLPDALFMGYPLLAGLLVYAYVENGSEKPFSVLVTFSAFGLILFLKGSSVAMLATTLTLSFSYLCSKNQKKLGLGLLGVSLFSVLVFWALAGYRLIDLPSYFLAMSKIVSGYTEAMFLNSNGIKLIHLPLYIGISIALIVMVLKNNQITKSGKYFLALLLAAFLFFSFKAGFVRHDGHAMISADALLLSAMLIFLLLDDKKLLVVLAFACLTWGLIVSKYRPNYIQIYANSVKMSASSLAPMHGKLNIFKNKYYTALDSLVQESELEKLPGVSDIYSFDQSYLIASGNKWVPRPVFQSYSAYTPELLRINEAHLRSSAAPDHIIFKPQTIDSRYPTLDDGLSWPTILHNYTLVKVKNDFAYLDKKNSENEAPTFELLGQKKQRLADKVIVPQDNGIIYVEMDIQATVFGKLMTTFFKPKRLTLLVEFDDGEKRRYRIISGMTKTGFIISPLIEKTEDFTALYNEDDFKQLRRVSHFKIKTTGGTRLFWKDSYNLKMSRIEHEYQL